MSVELEIYDLEGVVEEAVKAVIETHSLSVFTPQTTADFQKVRPRVELSALVQGGAGQLHCEIGAGDQRAAPGHMRECAWRMQLKVEAVASTFVELRTIRAKLRNIFSKIAEGITLTRHYLQSCRDAGSIPAYKGDDGQFRAAQLYDIDLSVQSDSWAELDAEES